ncbi:MAG: hypothetical protein IPJ88_18380 [Myxococcales bacterium]|nr:MAG: hypothetical protein IPJ88_18380 [Myxococcales bacterium]
MRPYLCLAALCVAASLYACSDNSLPGFAQGGPSCVELGILAPSETETNPDDGCALLPIPASEWNDFSAIYRPDLSDFSSTQPNNPIFQIQDTQNTETACVDLQMFTLSGDGWKGQTGEYTLDCEGSGLCFYVYPNSKGVLATAGDITIHEFPSVPVIEGKAYSIDLSNVTLGTPGQECYHIDSLHLEGSFSDLSGTL